MAEVTWYQQAEPLHNLICEAYASTSPSIIKELQQELESFKPKFLKLLDDPPKNADHRAELQRGRVKINRKLHTVNEDFIFETKVLSDNLNIDEYLAATLLQQGTFQRSRFDRPASETAILLYHSERSYLLNCLELIVKGAADVSVQPDVRAIFDRVAGELVNAEVHLDSTPSSRRGTFAHKIMRTIETLKSQTTSLTESGALESAITSVSVTDTQGRTGRMGEDITRERINRLKDERKELAHVLFHISYNRQLTAGEILALTEMLKKADLSDVVTIYFLVTLLASIDSAPEHILIDGNEPERHDMLSQNKDFLNQFNTLVADPNWTILALRAVITLQWTMFLLFALRKRPSLEQELHFRLDRMEQMMEVGVTNDAFQFITHYVLGFRESESEKVQIEALTFLTSPANAGAPAANGATAPSAADIGKVSSEVEPDFHWFIIHQLELFVTSFINKMSALLKRIKHREEDAVFVQQSSRPALAGATTNVTTRHDLEGFFFLISTLYRDRPNAGLNFWQDPEGRLYGFLKWASDLRAPGMLRAYFDMLGSLATGNFCAQYAYDFFNTNGGQRALLPQNNHLVSWSALFSALDLYGSSLRNPPAAPPAVPGGAPVVQPEILPDEIVLLKSFLRLLRQVVKYSPTARVTLYENQQYRVIYTLFNLLGCSVPVDLKAALLDTIAAFCVPLGGVGSELAKAVWVTLEQAQVLPTVKGAVQQLQYTQQAQLGGPPVQQLKEETTGILHELQEIESANETYPETLAFVNLLNALIHTPSKNATLRSGFGVGSPSIPENLGAGYRTPGGIIPYVNFVIDNVLLKANGRGYLYPTEKWRVIEASLKLVEKCLLSFDLSGLTIDSTLANFTVPQPPAASATTAGSSQSLLSYYIHPGFEIMTRLLCGSKLLDELFRIMNYGVDAVNGNAMNTLFFRKSVLRCLRIVSHVLEIQSIFLEILVPSITQNPSLIAPAKLNLPPSLVQIDQLLLYRQHIVVQIALFINCTDDEELCLLAVKILGALAESPYFNGTEKLAGGRRINRLVGILDATDESLRILHGFLERLEIDEPEKKTVVEGDSNEQDADTMPLLLEGAEASGLETGQPGMVNSVRLAILQILLDNVNVVKVPPTISHFLLGYSLHGNISQTEIKDPATPEARMSCLHVILNLLSEGIRGRDEDEDIDGRVRASLAVPLFIKHPTLAERCFHLIYKLCADVHTSSPTMRYLRYREDFFYGQFKAMPVRLDHYGSGSSGSIITADGVRSTVDYASLLSQLHQRAWLMKTVALELHLTTNGGQRSHTQRLLELMFSNANISQPTDEEDSEMDGRDGDATNVFGKSRFQQPLMKMLEILNSLNFAWKDSFDQEDIELYYFASLNLENYLQTNERGCTLYDIRAIYAFLLSWQNQLEKQGTITSAGHRQSIKLEIKRILEYYIAENHNRELLHARLHCLEAWKQVVEIALAKCFDLLPTDTRESILYDLISALLPKINDEAGHTVMAESLSNVVLSLMTKLRQDRHRQAVLQAAVALDDNTTLRLPADRLHVIFKGLVEAVQKPGSSVSMRGNIYTVLVNYLQYTSSENDLVTAGSRSPFLGKGPDRSMFMGVEDSTSLDASGSFIVNTNGSGQRATLEAGNIAIVNAAGDRFFEVLCRDASDGNDVWKTTAFTALDALSVLTKREKNNRVLQYVVKRNFLKHFIDMIKKDDEELQKVLQPDPESLNALYVYESKMSFFLRISQRRDGAERLLENGVIEVLAQSQFLDQRPETDANRAGFDMFLPPAIERYHQLLLPALQLLVAVLATMGRENTTVLNRVVTWVGYHQDMLTAILRDNVEVVTLTSLMELKLVTAIFYYLSSRPDIAEKMNGLAWSSFHLQILSLIPKYFIPDQWSLRLKPVTDVEREKDKTSAKYLGRALDKSVFRKESDGIVLDLCKNLLGYCQQLTDANGDRLTKVIKPVFVWTLTSAKDGDYSSGQNGSPTTPSLATLVIFLRNSVNSLTQKLSEHKDLTDKLSDMSTLTIEEMKEIAITRSDEFYDDLSVVQRQQLARRELQRMIGDKTGEINSTLYIIENALLLLWRHLDFYLNRYNTSASTFGLDADSRTSMTVMDYGRRPSVAMAKGKSYQPAIADVEVLKQDSSIVLQPILNKLVPIELTKETAGLTFRSRNNYIQMLIRRLKELLFQGGHGGAY